MMPTSVTVDDELMRAAMRAAGAEDEREAVELGLRTLVRLHEQAELRCMRGQLAWTANLDAMRTD